MRGLGLAHHGIGCQGRFVAHPAPSVVGIGFAVVVQAGLGTVTDKEQVTPHFDRLALLAFAQQSRHGHAQVLARQVEQCRLDGGHGMDGGVQIEGLQPAPAAQVEQHEIAPGDGDYLKLRDARCGAWGHGWIF